MAFKHLGLGSDEIRMATILPGEWTDNLRCHLIACKVSHAPEVPYKALSYVWGSANVTEAIELNDKPYDITINLACAIRHIRLIDQPVRIWIDSLCIDQKNLREKQDQIQLMRNIFANAQAVLVFLGDGLSYRVPKRYRNKTPQSRLSFEDGPTDECHLRNFQHSWAQCCKKTTWSPFFTIAFIRLLALIRTPDWTKAGIETAEPEIRQNLVEMLRGLVVAQWWRRIWVVQEVAVPQKVLIQWGHVTAPWGMFVRAAHRYGQCMELGQTPRIETDSLKVLAYFTTQVLNIESLRDRWKAGEPSDLLTLLQEFSDREASEPRDKVYALLGLTRQAPLIAPNYRLRVQEVYKRTIIALIKDSKSMSCFSGDLQRKSNPAFPSWIPDWNRMTEQCDRKRMVLQDVFCCCSNWAVIVVETMDQYWRHVEMQLQLLARYLKNTDTTPRTLSELVRGALVDYKTFIQNFGIFQHDEVESISAYLEHSRGRSVVGLQPWDWESFDALNVEQRRNIEVPWKHNDPILLGISGDKFLGFVKDISTKHRGIRELLDLLQAAYINRQKSMQTKCISPNLATFREEDVSSGVALPGRIIELFPGFGVDDAEETELERRHSLEVLPTTLGQLVIFTDYQLEKRLKTLKARQWKLNRIFDTTKARTKSICQLCDELLLLTDPGKRLQASVIEESELFSFSAILAETPTMPLEISLEAEESLNPLQALRLPTDRYSLRVPLNGSGFEASLAPLFNHLDAWYNRGRVEGDPSHGVRMDMLHTESERAGHVSWCGKRLTTWDDPLSSFIIIGEWMNSLNPELVRESFLRTLVGGICQRGGKTDLLNSADEAQILRWFFSEVLPRIQECNPIDENSWAAALGVSEDLREQYTKLDGKDFNQEMRLSTENRVLFRTRSGKLGLGPASITPGDQIHVLPGGRTFFVLRPDQRLEDGEKMTFQLVGDCFIDEGVRNAKQTCGNKRPLEGGLPREILGYLCAQRGMRNNASWISIR